MTINVRGPEYFREREREEYRRNSIKIVEVQAKEQFEKQMEEQARQMLENSNLNNYRLQYSNIHS